MSVHVSVAVACVQLHPLLGGVGAVLHSLGSC